MGPTAAAITYKKQMHHAQAITNRRLLAIFGTGALDWQIRWNEVRGLNKVSGKVDKFGVRDASGKQYLFSEDTRMVERVITQLVEEPSNRDRWPETQFDPAVV